MNGHPRRLTLQLTPLLDLLLIVIFAQFMEVRENQAAIDESSRSAVVERDQAIEQLAVLEESIRGLRQELAVAEAEMRAAQGEQSLQERRLEQIRDDLDRALAQHRVLGELVVELFQVPSDDVQKILDPANYPAGNYPDEELQRLRERFRELSMSRSGRMIEHLLSYEEIRKRADVWEVHIDKDNIATLRNGTHVLRPRLIDRELNVQTQQFEADFFNWYRSMPQPKGLVIILLTYDRETLSHVTRAIRELMPQLASRLQADSGGRTRFEFADLGFRID